jgi:hypothetical protein
VRDAERAIRAVSDARDLCLSLKRAFVGPRALERLRAGGASFTHISWPQVLQR